MSHMLSGGTLQDCQFCPFEDVLGLGHATGLTTILVPGAGEPNYDSFVSNPFQSRRERREQEVHQLLDKLQPETIVLDPDSIGRVRQEPKDVQKERQEQQAEANRARRRQQDDKNDAKTRMKGKNRPSKKHRKKQMNVIEEKKPEMLKRLADEERRKFEAEARAREARQAAAQSAPRALSRFYQ